MKVSQASRNHGIIEFFLEMLRVTKGPEGAVDLCVIHCPPELPASRGFVAGGAYRPGAGGNSDLPDTPGTLPPSDGSITWEQTEFLSVGEYVEFHGKMPCDGYVHLFNLGTSGRCAKLFPSREYPNNFEPAGAVFWVPSKRHCDIPVAKFTEDGPTTAETGKPERLLAIVTHDDVVLQIEDLHPRMAGYDVFSRCPTRGSAVVGPIIRKPKLFDGEKIRPEHWEYGLLEMEVRR
ncbi:MAG: DUF4384 domain-containing protein [Phycisphaerae bacterium]|nr:DUF4384 domain-containing protein [Phycisphaerae bacterium]